MADRSTRVTLTRSGDAYGNSSSVPCGIVICALRVSERFSSDGTVPADTVTSAIGTGWPGARTICPDTLTPGASGAASGGAPMESSPQAEAERTKAISTLILRIVRSPLKLRNVQNPGLRDRRVVRIGSAE